MIFLPKLTGNVRLLKVPINEIYAFKFVNNLKCYNRPFENVLHMQDLFWVKSIAYVRYKLMKPVQFSMSSEQVEN